jgi:hypothetical protein
MRTRPGWIGGLIVALALAAGAGTLAIAAQTRDQNTAQPPAAAGMHDAMKMHEQMMAAMHARDAKLDSLVKTMDGATGQAKIDAMAAILRELVQNDKDMHAQMGDMRERMMKGMGAAAPK